MILIIPNPTEELKKNLKHFEEVVTLTDKQKDIVIRGMRLVLLVGNENESLDAAHILDLLLPREQNT